MKKLLSLVTLGMVLSGCGTLSTLSVPGSPPPYSIRLTNLGYEALNGQITIPDVTAVLTSAAGASDIYDVSYTAVLLNGNGEPAAENSRIVPATGNLMSYAKGGYRCTSTPDAACTINSADSYFAANNTFPGNTVTNRALVPGEWAVAHLTAQSRGDTDSAAWYVRVTWTGIVNGRPFSWNQNYQFTNPAAN